MKDGRAEPEAAPAGRSPNEGVALVGLSSRLIGADEKASAILRAATEAEDSECASAGTRVLPPSLRARLTRDVACPARQTVRFGARGKTYVARVFPLKEPDGRDSQPRFILLLSEEASPEQLLGERCLGYGFTPREVDVLNGIAVGLTSKEIAARLGISTATVKCFTRMILIKTGARSRAGVLATLLNGGAADNPAVDSES